MISKATAQTINKAQKTSTGVRYENEKKPPQLPPQIIATSKNGVSLSNVIQRDDSTYRIRQTRHHGGRVLIILLRRRRRMRDRD
jgi:hypothetical protein